MPKSFNLEESRHSWSKSPQHELHLETVKQTNTKHHRKLYVILMCAVVIIIGLAAFLAYEITTKEPDQEENPPQSKRQINTPTSQEVTTQEPIQLWPRQIGNLSIWESLQFSLGNKVTWTHDYKPMEPPVTCSSNIDSTTKLCLEWDNNRRLSVVLRDNADHPEVSCYDLEWTALKCVDQVLTDCFKVSSLHWYGGYEDTYQLWPFERNAMNISAYQSHDGFWPGIGNVLERYFVSSRGAGIFIDNDVPLYFSLNEPQDGHMCFTAKYEKYPYFNLRRKMPNLKYTLCEGQNIKITHKAMSDMFIPRPTGIPHEDLFRYPIWSTWAQYHKYINQTNVIQYAMDIRYYNFSCAQFEIDEEWTPIFGDLTFDTEKFPNATEMVDEIRGLGFNVTVWVPPFLENNGDGFREANAKGYLVRQFEDGHAALTSWWDGKNSGLLDVSNHEARAWFLARLEYLKSEYHLDSFKFDAGEMEFLPNIYSADNMPENPSDLYPREYVEMAAMADQNNRQEVRCGYRTQQHPIFVRQIDKYTNWSGPNSLETVIPGVLTFGLIGYPFVLPDMVGGNAYGNLPDAELYIRWMQLNTFLPGLQLSIVPWIFNETVIDIVRRYVELRTFYSDDLVFYAKQAATTGEPIIRPLWWLEPESEMALTISDEFLFADMFLVAPILRPGSRSRDIYFPKGKWIDMLRSNNSTGDVVIEGPIVYYDYIVEIHELAYFKSAVNESSINSDV